MNPSNFSLTNSLYSPTENGIIFLSPAATEHDDPPRIWDCASAVSKSPGTQRIERTGHYPARKPFISTVVTAVVWWSRVKSQEEKKNFKSSQNFSSAMKDTCVCVFAFHENDFVMRRDRRQPDRAEVQIVAAGN